MRKWEAEQQAIKDQKSKEDALVSTCMDQACACASSAQHVLMCTGHGTWRHATWDITALGPMPMPMCTMETCAATACSITWQHHNSPY